VAQSFDPPQSPEAPIRVLLVEDDPQFAEIMLMRLSHINPGMFELIHVERLELGLKYLSRENVGVVLLDLDLPDSSGLNTFERIHQCKPEVPIIIITGRSEEEMCIEAVKKGAQDYLIKGEMDGKMIARIMRYGVERKKIEVQLSVAKERYQTIFENSAAAITVVD
jgi:two-component system, NarL family, sensor histidine kinase UhpB